ncbi:LysR family transcriptional regulator [Cereibacter azotoformans]|uniref:LysR family transcriptional regulator n=1 Tax=Cereibacter azotoformans TaxID=43057 RepID=A0A2T5JTS1_9RHOB|nr:LysR family transcriptional regulator [Cereibacter azotoformans]AXQ93450.1 LysR family transcriptional regulator [Cereibacter sphaeroides]MBO4168792.1 LysR family transcriptional regulator [Cereibacter azotoformans]PTR13563.1 LysR family transcriptional regulator [Cereibacter azotoformans]UIJ31782.1 LysR family transcriptional regulator [Cereibacter azotoformans]
MDWDDLRIFLAVARVESLSGAGRGLRLDPATVGRRVARLEEALGAPLFAKSPQGYALTEAGQRLLAHAERAEQAVTEAAEDLQGAAGLSGQIRIGAPDGCANYLLPQVLAAICDGNPGLEVQIVALPRVFNLSKREADMAIGVSRPEAGRLRVQKLADYHLHLAASRDYLARHPPIATLEDLVAHRMVGYIPDMIFDKELDYLTGLGSGAVPFASNSVSVQLNWLRAGAGVGIVHDFAMPSAPELVKILPEALSLRRSFWLIRHQDDARLERLNRFADALAQGLKREVLRLEDMTRP